MLLFPFKFQSVSSRKLSIIIFAWPSPKCYILKTDLYNILSIGMRIKIMQMIYFSSSYISDLKPPFHDLRGTSLKTEFVLYKFGKCGPVLLQMISTKYSIKI